MSNLVCSEKPLPTTGDCFRRDDLIESFIELAGDFRSIALIGVGGIGKTSISETV